MASIMKSNFRRKSAPEIDNSEPIDQELRKLKGLLRQYRCNHLLRVAF